MSYRSGQAKAVMEGSCLCLFPLGPNLTSHSTHLMNRLTIMYMVVSNLSSCSNNRLFSESDNAPNADLATAPSTIDIDTDVSHMTVA